MKAIVHIGMPKAGSTTLQEFLRLNAHALERQGFYYRRYRPHDVRQPEYLLTAYRALGREVGDPLHAKSYGVRTLADLDAYGTEFEAWLAGQQQGEGDTWVISSELLATSLRGERAARALDDWLTAHFGPVSYVIYLRRQDQWLVSLYSERLRNGRSERFADFLASFDARNYRKLVRAWSKAVGSDRITVRLLEPDALEAGDLIADFCKVAGIDPTGLVRPPRRLNESFSRPAAGFVRAMNAGLERILPPETTLSRALRKAGRVIAGAVLRGPKLALSAEESAAVLARFAASNEKLRQRYFPDRPALFAPPAAAPPPRPPDLNNQRTLTP